MLPVAAAGCGVVAGFKVGGRGGGGCQAFLRPRGCM